ncbi:MAG: benenodin family lasso peptide [Pseudomonadota bacterium]
MERPENKFAVADLGAASVETRGGDEKLVEIGGRQPLESGIADDD